jgi:type IV secretory pathway TrbL component
MNSIEDDPIIGRFFDTPEKKAKWLTRIKIAYILWIVFMIIGILFFLIWYVF